MKIFHEQSQLKQYLVAHSHPKVSIGFVPTMGAIHKGHLSLLEQALNENDLVLMSIFVNPTQFNNAEDLDKYPRTLDKDVALIKALSKKIVVYAPTVDDIYEGNTIAQNFDFDGLENEMEGANRPGHFDGVGTIVKKLFEIVEPTRAYFGEKDFQQLQIIRKMVKKAQMNIDVIGVPIYRQDDGLAMSSRNERLSSVAKEQSVFLSKLLLNAKDLFAEAAIDKVIEYVESEIDKKPEFKLEYFVIADEDTLKTTMTKEVCKKYRGFLVVHIEGVRLIDNIALN